MALATWPVGFPTLPEDEEDLIGALYQEPIRTEMEDGSKRARRRSLTTWTQLSPVYAFSHAQFPSFQAFVRDTLDHGTAMFVMPVWKPGVAGTTNKVVRIVGEITLRQTLPKIYARLPLEVRDY